MKLRRLSLTLVICIVASSHAWTAVRSQDLVRPSGPAITIDVSKGVLITLDRGADTVFVADPTIADVQVKSPRLIYLFGKDPGNTSLYAVDADQKPILSRTVVVKRDISTLQTALADLHPGGSVRVKAINKSVVLSGNVANASDAEEVKQLAGSFVTDEKQLVNRMTVDSPSQVNLRVRVTEVSHTVTKELGINWDTMNHAGSIVFGLATGNPVLGVPVPPGVAIAPLAPGVVGAAAAGQSSALRFFNRNNGLSGSTTDSYVLGANFGKYSIDSVIDALDQNGLVNILAEPNLTAMSGETATFLAGGEFPIVIPNGLLGQTTVQFKQYGVSLAFTPVVLGNGRISLRVRPEVSQLTSQGAVDISGINIPALSTRRAETTIELGSGESFAIGGLLQNSNNDNANTLPGLGNLPVLGALFRSTQFQHNETELVILVTPYIVRPVSDHRLAGSNDGYKPPNETDLFVRGQDAHPAQPVGGNAPSGPSGNGLIGPAGFILN
jgi:pilus assembly protein CpaC